MAKILIVDDQPYVQELFSEELADEGHRVEGVNDAHALRRRLKDSRPDLILLDLYLEGVKGWDLLYEIKSRDPHLPVLIVTAYDSFRDDPRLFRADGYWVKNFCYFESIKKKIAQVLGRGFQEFSLLDSAEPGNLPYQERTDHAQNPCGG